MSTESHIPDNLRYTRDHEWARLEDGNAVVGITDHAQHELGDIVHIEFPEIGKKLKKGDVAVEIESVKSVASVYAPFDGEVTKNNNGMDPASVNADPYGEGWLIEMTVESGDELLSADEYRKLLG